MQARQQTKKQQNKSFHWTHAFAVRNRILPTGTQCYTAPQCNVCSLDVGAVLPSKDDLNCIFGYLVPLVYREIVKYLPCYAPFKAGVQHHIPHGYSQQMSTKSEQVPLKMLYTRYIIYQH